MSFGILRFRICSFIVYSWFAFWVSGAMSEGEPESADAATLATFAILATLTTMTSVEFVPDRPFNDLRYPLDCSRLAALGWSETVNWAEGLPSTVAWFMTHSDRWEDVDGALVAHPRRGNSVPDCC